MTILYDEHVKEYLIGLELMDYYCDQEDGSESPWQRYKRENYILLKNESIYPHQNWI